MNFDILELTARGKISLNQEGKKWLKDCLEEIGNHPASESPYVKVFEKKIQSPLSVGELEDLYRHAFREFSLNPIKQGKTRKKISALDVLGDAVVAASEYFEQELVEDTVDFRPYFAMNESEESEFLEQFGDHKGEKALKRLKAKKYKFGDFQVVNTRSWKDEEGNRVVSVLVQRGEEEPFDVLIEE